MDHKPLPFGAFPLAEANGALVALLPPNSPDALQYILIENTDAGQALAVVLVPHLQHTFDDYLRVPQSDAVGARIVHLVDLLAEIQRRSPQLVQLPIANFPEAL